MPIVVSAVLFCVASSTRATPARDDSVAKLFDLMRVEQTYNQMVSQWDAMVEASAKQAAAAQGAELSTEQRLLVRKTETELKAAVPWVAIREINLQVYRESFTEEEIQQLIAFYESPTGQMFLEKMPGVSAKTMALSQQRIQSAMQKLEKELQAEREHFN